MAANPAFASNEEDGISMHKIELPAVAKIRAQKTPKDDDFKRKSEEPSGIGRTWGRCRDLVVSFLGYWFFKLLFGAWVVYLTAAALFDYLGEFDEKRQPDSLEHPTLPLILLTIISLIFHFFDLFRNQISKMFSCCSRLNSRYTTIISFTIVGLLCGVVIAVMLANQAKQGTFTTGQLISLLGYFALPLILVGISVKPRKINLRPVVGGLLIQVVFAIFVSTDVGTRLFQYLGNLAQTFLNFVSAGYLFLFGEVLVESNPFAFTVLPIVIYVSSVVGVLYYLGAMEWIIKKIGFVMYGVLRTSATESMVASGNIFIGQSESPLLVRPCLKYCTDSELLAIMSAGMGTVAGSTLGAYINFGVDPVYLITASFMAAPTVLALSKILCPETEQSKFTDLDDLKMEKDESIENVVDAAARGACDAVPLVANIAAALIAFISIAEAVDQLLAQFGRMVGFFDPEISLGLIFSYVFFPMAWVLGIDFEDLFKVSELLGKKLVINEFLAYEEMTSLTPYRSAGCQRSYWISKRSECITTYALCGFANISSMAITLGGLGPMAPNKRTNMSKLVFRALICGCFTSFMNAALAGFLGRVQIDPEVETDDGFYKSCRPFCCAYARNGESLNATESGYCDLTVPPAELDCFAKCEEFNFDGECNVKDFYLQKL